jgi:nickel superoxide dismutase
MYLLVKWLDKLLSFETAKAHCDVPCGIYDPIGAQIAALTVVRMMDLIADLYKADDQKDPEFQNRLTRLIVNKEEHAEKAKHEIRVIWGDMIKGNHVKEYPELPELTHKIMQAGSASRQSAKRSDGTGLIDRINEFADIFWKIKGVATKKAKAPYAPNLELVYPDL